VTPAESATNGATVSLGRPYPGLAMKTDSQRPASRSIAGGLWPEIDFQDEKQLLLETVFSRPDNTALKNWSRTCLAVRCEKGVAMLYYASVFLVIALIAGVLGFGIVAFAAAEIARILFFVFLVLLVVSLISHLSRRPLPRPLVGV
jgi:uncharacterized membrane protein YtjA (UPF0391 family)